MVYSWAINMKRWNMKELKDVILWEDSEDVQNSQSMHGFSEE